AQILERFRLGAPVVEDAEDAPPRHAAARCRPQKSLDRLGPGMAADLRPGAARGELGVRQAVGLTAPSRPRAAPAPQASVAPPPRPSAPSRPRRIFLSCHACSTTRGIPTVRSPPRTTSAGNPCWCARSAYERQ